MIKIAICDSDADMLNYLDIKIHECYGCGCETEKFKDAEDLLAQCCRQAFDILFSEIDINGFNGIVLAHEIRRINRHTKIIFVTDIEEYVFEAYKCAFRYIRKPHIEKELPEGIFSLKKLLLEAERTELFHTKDGIFPVKLKCISYAEVLDHTLTIHLRTKTLSMRMTMDELERLIGDFGFIRVHKSFLINYRYICYITPYSVVLNDGTEIPLSKKRSVNAKFEFERLLRYS